MSNGQRTGISDGRQTPAPPCTHNPIDVELHSCAVSYAGVGRWFDYRATKRSGGRTSADSMHCCGRNAADYGLFGEARSPVVARTIAVAAPVAASAAIISNAFLLAATPPVVAPGV